ncbi:MAG: ABC transporter substrate-binding protein [Chloroflexi bacterium]|nr:ABC transporter substrate-binding protein [Chloroflexota bacterium]
MRARNLVCLMAVGLMVSSCSPAIAPTPTQKSAAPGAPAAEKPKPAALSPTSRPSGEQPKYGGMLTFAHAAEPASFDLHQESGGQHPLFLTQSYNGLLQYDPLAWPEAKVISDLASTWKVSPDGLEYTFQLKEGAKWHDGKPFTSQDVQVSLDRIRKPPRGMRSPRQAAFGSIGQVEAISGATVRVRLQRPSASLIANLATDWLAMVPKHVVEAKGDMKRDVVGTGPFKLKGFVAGTSYDYVKNPDYFVKGRPYLDAIKVYLIKDEATRFAALRTGRLLLLPPPYGVSVSQSNLAKSDQNLVVQTNWRPTLRHLRFNLEKAPWSDPRVRRAMSLAIDRQALVATVFEGGAIPGVQMPSAGLWGIPEDELLKMPGFRQPKDADVAEAKRLLAEAGLAGGFSTTVLTRPEEVYQKMGTFFLAEVGKLGIKGELQIRVTAAFDDALGRGAFDVVVAGTATAIDDPDLRFGENYVTGAGRNYGKYSNPKLDELFEKQSQALDVDARKKLVREMLNILLQDNPDVPFSWDITYISHSSRLRNYKIASSPYVNSRHQEVWLAN